MSTSVSTPVSASEHPPITFTTTSTIVEPKKRGRSKKNATASTTTTTNTTTITITPKFIGVDHSGDGSDDCIGEVDHNFKNEIVSPSCADDAEGAEVSETTSRNIFRNAAANHTQEENDECGDGLYKLTQFNYDLLIPFILINMHASSRSNILALLHTTLVSCIEGRCISEGFIKPETVKIVDFKCGKIVAKNVQFNLVIECYVSNPVENSVIDCIASNITQAGIRAISNDKHLPVVVYISRDYSILTQNTFYNTIKEGDKISVRVIGKRFEMNDKFIQIIGELVSPKKERVSLKTAKKSSTASPITTIGSIDEVTSTSTSTSSSTSSSTSTSTSSSSSTTATPPITISQKITKAPKAPKAPKEPKEPKAPKPPKEPKAPKEPKEPKAPKKSIKSNVDA